MKIFHHKMFDGGCKILLWKFARIENVKADFWRSNAVDSEKIILKFCKQFGVLNPQQKIQLGLTGKSLVDCRIPQ